MLAPIKDRTRPAPAPRSRCRHRGSPEPPPIGPSARRQKAVAETPWTSVSHGFGSASRRGNRGRRNSAQEALRHQSSVPGVLGGPRSEAASEPGLLQPCDLPGGLGLLSRWGGDLHGLVPAPDLGAGRRSTGARGRGIDLESSLLDSGFAFADTPSSRFAALLGGGARLPRSCAERQRSARSWPQTEDARAERTPLML